MYSIEFNFDNKPSTWENVYKQKIKDLKIPKVCEFNFNLLQYIAPCGQLICKWQKDVSNACEHCSEIETRYMLL